MVGKHGLTRSARTVAISPGGAVSAARPGARGAGIQTAAPTGRPENDHTCPRPRRSVPGDPAQNLSLTGATPKWLRRVTTAVYDHRGLRCP